MLGLGSGVLRVRAGSFAGLFVMISMTVMIAAAAGQIMATALGAPGPGRFATADAVVRADPTVKLGHGDNADKSAWTAAHPGAMKCSLHGLAGGPTSSLG